MISGAQSRAARGLLGWNAARLAAAAAVGIGTVRDFEAGRATPFAQSVEALRRALERAGIEFVDGGQPGVRLKPAGEATIPVEDLNASNDE